MSEAAYKTPALPALATKAILESKRPELAEIELTLFENCPVNCHFCFHDKKSPVGLTRQEMFSKIPLVTDFLDKQKGRVQLAQINLVGGELLQDRWMERLCSNYFDLLVALAPHFARNRLKMKVVLVSNFLFEKRERVKQLIDDLRASSIDAHLIASYDFCGRPTSKSYYQNIDYFGPDYITSINLVGTRQSIHAFQKNEDDYFRGLYRDFNIYFDDFIPDPGSEDSLPSDREFYQWYCFIAENYPKIGPVAELLKNQSNKMHCLSLNKITIFPDGRTSNCRWYRYRQEHFNTKLDMKDNAGMMQNFLDEMGCLSCRYFQRCGFRCFTQWDWKKRRRDMQQCPVQAFFDYAEKAYLGRN